MNGDASALYNAGTSALESGRLGEAIAFLAAARRIEPRAADIRRNLEIAERTAAASRGEASTEVATPAPFALAAVEAWWLGAFLVAAGAASGIAALTRPGLRWIRALRVLSIAAIASGALLGGWMTTRAVEESRRPEAVVVAPNVEARRGVDEAPRPPVLLRAGERVRAGAQRGDEVEVWLGGTAIGWVPRAALWRLSDTPRYTPPIRPR